jgi:hypothetical protein
VEIVGVEVSLMDALEDQRVVTIDDPAVEQTNAVRAVLKVG